jgi:hypothetical protein
MASPENGDNSSFASARTTPTSQTAARDRFSAPDTALIESVVAVISGVDLLDIGVTLMSPQDYR